MGVTVCVRIKMAVRNIFWQLFFGLAIVLPAFADEDEVTELKIDVLKSVAAEDCLVKSANGDTLHMHYTGTLFKDGSEFDSSIKRGKLTIPPALGYGARGFPPKIPANSVLVFDVELVKIERK